jgi:hypothetical protein
MSIVVYVRGLIHLLVSFLNNFNFDVVWDKGIYIKRCQREIGKLIFFMVTIFHDLYEGQIVFYEVFCNA